MFRKFFIFALFATACGYVFASDFDPCNQQIPSQQVWPIPGSDADIRYDATPNTPITNNIDDRNNVRIVSKAGADVVVENNISMGGEFVGRNVGAGWAGGADLTHPYQAPSGFNIFESQAEIPLMHTEMMEDDGGSILSISRSNKSNIKNSNIVDAEYEAGSDLITADNKFEVEDSDTKTKLIPDQVRSWVVASGQTLREVLQDWCDKEGWDLVWNTSREYPIQASAVFKGRFMDVSSALVRNFSRATPIPYAKFFKGNRVLVITTMEE
ncbi:MAG: toxin co-regulated pilus biosynthesis Q family protein [Alphaproteobacteria bacterium]|jgi:hypothetical protein|nr:hypothetical protein [Alphaproteobacteria bacterium]